MKTNHIKRKLLLLAHLCISSCPVDAAYAVDPDSCDPILHVPFIDAEMVRVSTLAKFVSLNLGNNGRRNPETNPQGWYYDDYVRAQVKLLMGNTQDAYVISTDIILSSRASTRYLKAVYILDSSAQRLLATHPV